MRKYPLTIHLLRFYQKNLWKGIIWNKIEFKKQSKVLSDLTNKLRNKSQSNTNIIEFCDIITNSIKSEQSLCRMASDRLSDLIHTIDTQIPKKSLKSNLVFTVFELHLYLIDANKNNKFK